MPTTAAAGPYSVAKDTLRNMLADCWHFQRWNDPDNPETPEDAKKRIYLDALPNADELEQADYIALRPFALIYREPVNFFQDAETNAFRTDSVITILFEENVDSSIDVDELTRVFENLVGQVVMSQNDAEPGLIELRRVLDKQYLAFNEITDEGPARCQFDAIEEYGDHHRMWIDVRWGYR